VHTCLAQGLVSLSLMCMYIKSRLPHSVYGTSARRLFCKVIQKPHPDRYQLQTIYGIINRYYPTKELQHLPPNFTHPDLVQLQSLSPYNANPLSLREAAHLSTSTLPETTRKCKGKCETRQCSYKHLRSQCTTGCHSKALNVRTNLVQLQTLNRPLQGLQKNKISIVVFVFPDYLFFLKLFYFYYSSSVFPLANCVLFYIFAFHFDFYLYRGWRG